MRMSKLLAAVVLSAAVLAPSLASARYHHHRWHYARYVSYYGYVQWYPLPYHISYKHNYGPGYVPGTFAFYDGPATNHCYQGAAAYLGQDRRRHPCF
jgi:hypothetical protein